MLVTLPASLKTTVRRAVPRISWSSTVRNHLSRNFSHGSSPERLTAEQAVSKFLRSGSSVWIASGPATPQSLLQAMVAYGCGEGALRNVHVYQAIAFGKMPHVEPQSLGRVFRTSVFFVGSNMRDAVNSGRADYVPAFLSDIPGLFRRGVVRADVAFIQVSAPDSHGNCSINCVDITAAAMDTAKYIIAEVNPQAPRTFGQSVIPWSRITAAVEVDHPMPEVPEFIPTEAEQQVADIVARELVRDDSTIQLGIGGIPDGTYAALRGHKQLAIHTELLTTGVATLAAAGALNPSRKVVTSLAWGTSQFWKFLDNNANIEFQCVGETNKHSVIAQQPRMTSINSCIEVDTSGQMASDSIGYYIYSGFGGQVDFLRGVACSEDGEGRSIIALSSTTKDGSSRIVHNLREGAGVVSTRAHVHYVVTEHGIADLRAQSLRARAHRLIAIAAPQHREQLERDAYKRLGTMPGED